MIYFKELVAFFYFYFTIRKNATKLFFMLKETNLLEKSFDILSKIPFLKTIMKALWVFSTSFLGFMIAVRIFYIVQRQISFDLKFLKILVLYVLINSIFIRIFFLWDKQEKKIKEIEKK